MKKRENGIPSPRGVATWACAATGKVTATMAQAHAPTRPPGALGPRPPEVFPSGLVVKQGAAWRFRRRVPVPKT
jgi:hypothetical protein